MIKRSKSLQINLNDNGIDLVNQKALEIDLSIVIPVYNKYNFTKSCLSDLSHLPHNHEIVIVDNGSVDETKQELEKLVDHGQLNLIYVRNEYNYGFAKACNIGYSVSNGKNVCFLNNDIRVKSNHSNWTFPLISNCDNGLVGPTMGQLDNNLNFVQEANKILNGKSYMSGWCLASSKQNWEKLEIVRPPIYEHDTYIFQIFSEEFGLAYFEDTDLSFRAKQLGIPFKVVDIPVVHFGKITSRQLNTHKLYLDARRIFINKWAGKI
jgi:hypothetical protein